MLSQRILLLGLIVLGAGGLAAELVLLEHYEEWRQWIPLVLLASILVVSAVAWRSPGRRSLRAFRAVMVLCVVAGGVGIWFHYQGNVEFELERHPQLGGARLFWESIRGATPALAPGALAQLGLLGLLFTYRHPALGPDAAHTGGGDRETSGEG